MPEKKRKTRLETLANSIPGWFISRGDEEESEIIYAHDIQHYKRENIYRVRFSPSQRSRFYQRISTKEFIKLYKKYIPDTK